MPRPPVWKYCTTEHCRKLLYSLELFGGASRCAKKQAALLYSLAKNPERHYRKLALPKQDGGIRHLCAPDPLLKMVQTNILRNVLNPLPPSPYATAYRSGFGIVRNAAPHTGQKIILKLDIRDFFPSITFPMVYKNAFPAHCFPPSVRGLLTGLCCCRDSLPQGAPTSPAISNLVMKPFDEAMGAWCAGLGVTYTRYCDDMTFSGDFDHQALIKKAACLLKPMGFTLNSGKTKLLRPHHRQAVTGIVVNKTPQASRAFRDRLRQEVYYCQTFGVDSHLRRTNQIIEPLAYLRSLFGKVNYVLQIRPEDKQFQKVRAAVLQMLKKASA